MSRAQDSRLPRREALQRPRARRILVLASVAAAGIAAAGVVAYRHATSPERLFREAVARLRSGPPEALVRAADALAGRAGYGPHAALLRGAAALDGGRPYEALDHFRKAADHEATRVHARVLAGEALVRVGDYRQAVAAFEDALAINPDLPDVHRRLAAVYSEVGATAAARGHLERLAELAPDDPQPHRQLGLMSLDLEQFSQAADAFAESLRRDPDQPDRLGVLQELAEAQLRLNRFSDALEALAPCPPTPDVLAMRAEGAYGRGDRPRADALLDESLRAEPDNFAALVLRGTILLDAGDAERALPPLARAAGLRPSDFAVRFKLAHAYRRLGKADLARRELDEGERMRGLRDEYSALYERSAREPGDADLRFQLGRIAAELGDDDFAAKWYAAALAIDPRHEAALAALRSGEAGRTAE